MSPGLLPGIWGRVGRKLEKRFLGACGGLLIDAPVLHVGGRSRDDIDAGGVLGEFIDVLVRDRKR